MSIENTIDPLQPSRLIRNASEYHRIMRHRLAVPRRLVNPVIRGLKHIVNPSEKAKRSAPASLMAQAGDKDRALEQNGYLLFGREDFPDLQGALDTHGPDILRVVGEASDKALQNAANKSMLTTVISNSDFYGYPGLMAFAVSHPIIDLATRYFGRVPLLTSMSVWWSPPNDSMQQSQLYHCDGEDARQLKFFFNVTDVTEEQGPFTLLPGGISDRIRAAKGIVARKVRDEEIEEFDGDRQKLVLTGKAGEGACVDTCRCLHYGSRGNSKPRIVMMLRFNDHLAPNVDIPDWHSRSAEYPGDLDGLQKLVLGLQTA